jgi:hypothetical protein
MRDPRSNAYARDGEVETRGDGERAQCARGSARRQAPRAQRRGRRAKRAAHPAPRPSWPSARRSSRRGRPRTLCVPTSTPRSSPTTPPAISSTLDGQDSSHQPARTACTRRRCRQLPRRHRRQVHAAEDRRPPPLPRKDPRRPHLSEHDVPTCDTRADACPTSLMLGTLSARASRPSRRPVAARGMGHGHAPRPAPRTVCWCWDSSA